MSTVLLLIHVMIAMALVGVILLQRSEGGALGIGGGGGGGGAGFMTGRSAGDALTRATAILAACFFATSLTLSILASHNSASGPSIVPTSGGEGGLAPLAVPGESEPAAPAAPVAPSGPQVPQSN
ncbi:preprotein translocase subunit SecG [Methyloceanibacter caenitepidi]|uniref:Protein-export membrane protein SecG n=1 Tax=Methyloceanibacter caenitepidi TaxID=1384459 RepID=A0A0A8K445_9HYPH|nr:preprotein translocase subunit SecG [Methyloceanibacter caenitepidi]BAQ17561.1 preprotein translocase subunit SecG [Methyloceanibacter caenitepidi]